MDLPVLLALLLAIRIAISDLYARRVSNRWLAAAIGAGLGWMLLFWMLGRTSFPVAGLLGAIAGLLALMPFYVLRWMGAGDVKYFAVIGLLLGWQALLPVWIVASLISGAHAVGILASRYAIPRLPALQMMSTHIEQTLHRRDWWHRLQRARGTRRGMPYAAYLSVGVFVWVFGGMTG